MLGFPQSTEFNRRIPKQKFYENLTVTPTMKKVFVDQIKIIYWRNKLASATINLAAGSEVSEIEVFEVRLNSTPLDEAVLRLIDKEVPYHILFLLEYEGRYQAWTAYKEISQASNAAFKVSTYYHTDWMQESELPLKIDGLNLDSVYENFVRQIAGDTLAGSVTGETLKQSVNRSEQREALKKQLIALEAKLRKEKQFNKQIEINAEIKSVKAQLALLM